MKKYPLYRPKSLYCGQSDYMVELLWSSLLPIMWEFSPSINLLKTHSYKQNSTDFKILQITINKSQTGITTLPAVLGDIKLMLWHLKYTCQTTRITVLGIMNF